MNGAKRHGDIDGRTVISREDYERAERYLPWNAQPLVYQAGVTPHWIAGSDRCWYRVRRREGFEFVLVDPERGVSQPAFDHARLAAALSRATGVDHDRWQLPFEAIELDAAGQSLQFECCRTHRRCDLASYVCHEVEPVARVATEELRSPDGRWAAFVNGHDLCVRSLVTGEERRLTDDGEPDHEYGRPTDVIATGVSQSRDDPEPPHARWSPESRRLVTHRLDQRRVARMPLVQSIAPNGARPVLHTYRYALPGDEEIPLARLVICDVERGTCVELEGEPLISPCLSPFDDNLVWWSADGQRVFFIREERGYQTIHLCVADAETGAVRTILTECSETWVDSGPRQFSAEPVVRTLASGEILWWSERDGWGHLYLYGETDGDLRRQVTRGAWQVRAIKHVDEAERLVYFTAGGREPDRNPYFDHLYCVAIDGGEPELLTPEDAHHEITFAPSGRWFVDSYSRVDLAPVAVLRGVAGQPARTLEQADIAELLARGWRLPERFSVTARDGVTDIYGVLFYPSTFDPAGSYPVVDDLYPGPHNIRSPIAFPTESGGYWNAQALAEVGFIVMTLDGLGTAWRSKAFHNAAWDAGFGEAGGLEDHVVGLRQLAAERPYLDLSRVGAYGHSGGGYAAARAILAYPDFYTVAVAASGNHDQRGYHPQWGEHYLGLPVADRYDAQANGSLAANLRGKLLLIHGELDDDVHPSMTLQLVDELIAANKDFDLLIVPGANHEYCDLRLGRGSTREESLAWRYVLRRRWDYFVRHLLDTVPPAGYEIRAPASRRKNRGDDG